MKAVDNIQTSCNRCIAITVGAVLFLLCGSDAKAQETRWLDVGSMHSSYTDHGTVGGGALSWPGVSDNVANGRGRYFWIAARNFTDRTGRHFPVKVIHMGTGSTYIGSSISPQDFRTTSRFDPPDLVTVDGFQSFRRGHVIDEIDPSLGADRMILTEVDSQLGITMEKKVFQFSQEHHDNYNIIEYTLTNTGRYDDDFGPAEGTTLEDVYVMTYHRFQLNQQGGSVVGQGATWGKNQMNEKIGHGHDDFTEDFPDNRGFFAWHGYEPNFTDWNNIGAPAFRDSPSLIADGDSIGRLTAAHMVGELVLHVDTSPSDPSHNPAQPSTMTHIEGDDPITLRNDPFDNEMMQLEYETMTRGLTPVHADIVNPPVPGLSWRERQAYGTGAPNLQHAGGQNSVLGYGPFTIEPGESIRLVVVAAVAGLSQDASIAIGREYKRAHRDGDGNRPIEYQVGGEVHAMSKNEWVMTARDSLFQTFKRAKANFESNYNIPQAPLPPRHFDVVSLPDRIELTWSAYPEGNHAGFEVYRTANRRDNPYELVAALGPNEFSYNDEDVIRGVAYYYYIQSVGEVNNDGTGLTPTGMPLKSNRYYAQTYDPAFLKREPGSSLAETRVVPNPFILTSSNEVRWADQRDRIGFLDIPANATIHIYTQLGELIETIEHSDGSGDAFWNLTTSSNQVAVSGIYLAVIEDNDTGDRIMRKFAIIR